MKRYLFLWIYGWLKKNQWNIIAWKSRIASSNDDKGVQLIDLIKTYGYGTTTYLVFEKEEAKCNNIIRQYKIDWLSWCYKRKHMRT